LVFLRDEIREVRLERPDRQHLIAGAAIGGAAGLAIGALASARSGDPETRRAAPAFSALLDTVIGAGVGHTIHQHGPVLYQRR
jgi:outer membrane lipoprotein SlyB